ncbi:MAG: mechanosensitive ion channel family protein [Candidatus Omnitrophica bacterium]|nr:mechanosensitive ion channel family protein [Candidatus Omnitrophota bacterium]
MQAITFYGIEINAWLYAPVVYFLWVSIFLIIKKIVFSKIEKIAQKTTFQIDDILLGALNFPLVLFAFISGAFILDWLTPIDKGGELTKLFFIALKTTAVVAVVFFIDALFRNLIRVYGNKIDILKSGRGIAQGIIRVVVIGLGILILLDSFGISITPIIASLGIGSLAVALALQPTLENFFAGIQIMIDKPIMVGHFIKLDSGEEGYVERIGWRSTWVRFLANNVVVIPNNQLVSSKILNYYYPEKELAVLVQVGVHYSSDLEKVEQITIDVAEKVLKSVQGGVATFKPFIRYHTFNSSSIDFTVILRAQEFVDNYLIKHEFIKALQKRYNKEGIVIPFPIRAINYDQEKAVK